MRRILASVVATLAFLVPAAAGAETIALHGSTTVMNTLAMPNKAQIEAMSGQRIEAIGNGSQRGLADLAAGKAQIAMISAPLELEAGRLNEMRPGSVDVGRLTAYAMGEARVAFAVHPSNPVRKVSSDQLRDILSGRIANWREVGGPDQPIIVVASQRGSAEQGRD